MNAERFWSNVVMIPEHECYEWAGSLNRKGYGRFGFDNGERDYAHRAVWTLERGPIPDGLCVLHHCDNPSCVRIDHLFLGTLADNMYDMKAKGRGNNANRGKVVCIRGHELSEDNVYRFSSGKRQCKKCTKIREREFRQRHKGTIT